MLSKITNTSRYRVPAAARCPVLRSPIPSRLPLGPSTKRLSKPHRAAEKSEGISADIVTDEAVSTEVTQTSQSELPDSLVPQKVVVALDPNLKVNEVRSGVVESIGPNGVFVDIGAGPSGLLLKNKITAAWDRPHLIDMEDVQKMFSVGSEIKVMVHRVDTDRQRFSLSTKSLEASPGDMLKNPQLVYENAEEGAAASMATLAARRKEAEDREKARGVDSNLKVHDLRSGVVQGSKNYGVFVDIGEGSSGLLHSSLISHEPVSPEDIQKMFSVGAEIKVMVHEVDHERQRITLSTKSLEVNPGDMVKDPQMVYEKAEETASAFQAKIAASEQEKGV